MVDHGREENKIAPLEGIRILDLTRMAAGPFGTMLLGDMGADVVKVEPPAGDDCRYLGPPFVRSESSYFLAVNRNKRSIVLELKSGADKEALLELVRKSDVFVHNFRPGIPEKLGIDYESIKRVNPEIVYFSISAFGETGPYASRPGLDLIFQGMSGAMSIIGEPGQEPLRCSIPIADMAAGLYTAYGILSALMFQRRTGKGQKVEYNLLDGMFGLQSIIYSYYFALGRQPDKIGSGSYTSITERFHTSDGYINVSIPSSKFWRLLCSAIGATKLSEDDRFKTNTQRVENREDLLKELEGYFLQKTTAEWLDILVKGDIPCGPVYTYYQAIRDPQVLHNGVIVEYEHPSLGKLKMVSNPIKMGETPVRLRHAPPLLGEHSNEIRASLFG